jgi:GTP:adenosylcobinamide-phosphate guanylyltransferase/thiamine kinase-like enzyme
MNIDYIVVQAGGKGTRLKHLTANKPKPLVPVENLPVLFHLFRKYPDKRFIIIADYKSEVLRKYLECFAEVKYLVVEASGSGTCGGVGQAVRLLPDKTPFMLIWSDIILPDDFAMPTEIGDYVGISKTFSCRWSYDNGAFYEESSEEHGVAGLFVFQDKMILTDLPESGEFVRWLQGRDMNFSELSLAGTKEFGLLSAYEQLTKDRCRPFNKMTIKDGIITKVGIDEQGRKLAHLECNWYDAAIAMGVKNTPHIYGTNPLRMELINGKNIYEYRNISDEAKLAILDKLTGALKALHDLGSVPVDRFSIQNAYYTKTIERIDKIRDLVPLSDKRFITVNSRKCRNIFFYQGDLQSKLDAISCDKFAFIHGDCTFSNLMLRNDSEPVFIDPRGYFGYTKLYGDPNYDWAKLYYSIVGNYDRFNLKDFRLTIGENDVTLNIQSNGWEALEDDFWRLSGADPGTIKLLHAIIWLSLTTYAWQDYDSICGAFYNGLYYLEEIL